MSAIKEKFLEKVNSISDLGDCLEFFYEFYMEAKTNVEIRSDFIRITESEMPDKLMEYFELAFREDKDDYKIVISTKGSGESPDCPFIAILYKNDNPRQGYYVAILFKKDMSGFYVSLNQGTSWYDNFLKNKVTNKTEYIKYVTNTVREQLGLPETQMDLKSTNSIPKSYEKANIYSIEFSFDELKKADKNSINDRIKDAVWDCTKRLFEINELVNNDWEQYNLKKLFINYCQKNSKINIAKAKEDLQWFQNKFKSIGDFNKLTKEEYAYTKKADLTNNTNKPLTNQLIVGEHSGFGPKNNSGITTDNLIVKFENNEYIFKTKYATLGRGSDETWEFIKNDMTSLFESVKNANRYEDIKRIECLDTLFVFKLAYGFCPDKLIGIGKKEYLYMILDRLLGYKNIDKKMSSIQLSFLANQKLRELMDFENTDSTVLTGQLWNFFGWSEKDTMDENYNNLCLNYKKENAKNGKNIIVYGVPGSGKSYYIENELLQGVDKDENTKRVTFYPEYTYYDFVGQMIPAKDGKGLEPEKGVFTSILEKALNAENEGTEEHYYLIIEELNRGNAEAIFGDVFQLLDRDESGKSRYKIDNSFIIEALGNKYKSVYIPSNLSIYATINNADQNVFNMDTAFGRRWKYELKLCDDKNEKYKNTKNLIFYEGKIKGTNKNWNELRQEINSIIIKRKDAIFNAEEKRLGLYYIDEELLYLEENDSTNGEMFREEFANKILRYLYLNVFKNQPELIFKNTNEKILEDYICDFKSDKNGDLSKILELPDYEKEEEDKDEPND